MVRVQPPDPSGGGVPLGPDPLMVLLRLLRREPKGTVEALLTPLRSSSPLVWSVSVPGIKIPLIISLPPESLPGRISRQIFPGTIFEENKRLFFRGGEEGGAVAPFLLFLGDVPDGVASASEIIVPGEIIPKDSVFGSGERSLVRSGQNLTQNMSEPLFLRSGEVPNPLFQTFHGPVPLGIPFPGGAPPSLTFEICWPDQGDQPSQKQPGAVSSVSFSFRLSIAYANGESLELPGVFDHSSRKISFYPRSSSRSLLSYWSGMGRDLGAALEEKFSILMEGHRRDHD